MRKVTYLFSLLLFFFASSASYAQQNWVLTKGEHHIPGTQVYGTSGLFHPDNTPGARSGSAMFSYNGRLYVFGGSSSGYHNDLWEYDSGINQWRWIKGVAGPGAVGNYGIQGIPAATNLPGGRSGFAHWIIGSRFYIFGGSGHNASGTGGMLSDLWEYDFATGNWTWLKGSSAHFAAGSYGTLGAPAAANAPGNRAGAVYWTQSGKLFLFGGESSNGHYNDLWEYDPATANWTWIKGANAQGNSGSWGSKGLAAATNNPPATAGMQSWWTGSKLYCLGGVVQASTNRRSALWEYDPASNIWTWIKGPSTANEAPVFGALNTAAASGTPGCRSGAYTWTRNGRLYLFGGSARNDLWEYDTSTTHWTWFGGDSLAGLPGIYTLAGAANSSNKPGARSSGNAALHNGGLYLFGGAAAGLTPAQALTNELWKLDLSSGHWTWLHGHPNTAWQSVTATPTIPDVYAGPNGRSGAMTWQLGDELYLYSGEYYDDLWSYNTQSNNWKLLRNTGGWYQTPVWGAKGVAAPANTPGRRINAATWVHDSLLYLFGGESSNGPYNDLWTYAPSSRLWTWIGGPDSQKAGGIWGTRGTGSPANRPSARDQSFAFTFNSKLYLFGGSAAIYPGYYYNDLWEYDPANGTWTWLKGDSTANARGIYGTAGVAAALNTPGARTPSCGWIHNGRLYIFGGYGYPTAAYFNATYTLGDLWEYDFNTGNWRWLKGINGSVTQIGVYGTKGTGTAATLPGQRIGARSWTAGGQLYLFGGYGQAYNSSTGGMLGDMWRYDPPTNIWTWIKGSQNPGSPLICAGKGIGDPANTPAAQKSPSAWTAGSRIYLLGTGREADLWYFDTCGSAAACYASPLAPLAPSASICNGFPLILNAGNTGYAYLWSTGDTTQNIAVTATGSYWVKVSGPSAAPVYDTVSVISAASPVFSLGADTAICSGQSLILQGSPAGAGYRWNTGQSASSISATLSGLYILTVTANGCTGADTINLNILTLPRVALGADTGVCPGTALSLDAGGAGVGYRWSSGDTTQRITASLPATYIARVTGMNGCVGHDTLVLAHLPAPVLALGPDGPVCGDSLVLNAFHAGSTYRWNTGDTGASLTARSDGHYAVSATGANGCSSADTVVLSFFGIPGADSIDIVSPGPLQGAFSTVGAHDATIWHWSFGDGATDTGAAPLHTYSTPGIYMVRLILSNAGGCADTLYKTMEVRSGVGVEGRRNDAAIGVFPNPAGELLRIANHSKEAIRSCVLLDITGRALYTSLDLAPASVTVIPVQGLAPGIYTLRIVTSRGMELRKVRIGR